MKASEIINVLGGELVVPPAVDVDVLCGFGSDLMSDVLVFAEPQMLLITGLMNPQAVRTAEMADIPVIVFVRGKRPQAETLALAKDIGIGVILSSYTMFETCGLLYRAGLPGLGKVASKQL